LATKIFINCCNALEMFGMFTYAYHERSRLFIFLIFQLFTCSNKNISTQNIHINSFY